MQHIAYHLVQYTTFTTIVLLLNTYLFLQTCTQLGSNSADDFETTSRP